MLADEPLVGHWEEPTDGIGEGLGGNEDRHSLDFLQRGISRYVETAFEVHNVHRTVILLIEWDFEEFWKKYGTDLSLGLGISISVLLLRFWKGLSG